MLAALLLAAGCASPPAIAVQGDHHPLVSRVEALVDRERALSFEDVTRAPGCNAFRPVSGQPNFGAIAGAAWLRFAPRWTGPMGDWRLVVRFAGLERVCAHWPLAAGGTAVECLVRGEPTQRARWQNGLLTFAAPADLAREAPVHVQVESELWLKAPLELVTVEALVQRETRREHAWGVYYGLLAMLVVVSLGFYLGRRDRAFLYFAFKIGALTLALALWQGRFAAWDPQAFSLTRLTPVFAAVFLAFGSRFYQQFLLTRRYARPAHRILEACFWAALATALMVAPYPVSAVQLLSATTLVWLLTVLWAAAMRVRERYWPALWVLGAVSVLWLSVLAVSLSIIGMPLVSTGLGLQLTYVGNMVAAAFLVFGLVERVRLLGAERDRATELASANRNLALYRAHFDELTGLPNRSKLREDLQECIAQAGAGARMAVVTLGPDRFRSLNHALGHEGGDAVLVEIAGRLRHEIRTDELLARVAPARFVALLRLQPAADLAELDERCAQMRRALATPLLAARGSTLSMSIGAALFPEHGHVADVLLRASEEAYYRARELGAGMLRVYDPQFHQHAERYLELHKDLRQALARDELELHYQPLCSMQHGEVAGVEALLRWPRNGELIAPDQFIPFAESTDLIGPLTDWVFRRACRQARAWANTGLPVPAVSVNVSATQFRLPDFVSRIDAALAEHALPGGALAVEITESVLVEDLEATRATLQALRARGVGVAVDDFGVGYSSLAYLRSLPVGSLKIDRSFLLGIPQEPEAVAVINAIIALGHELGLSVTAEGIETPEQHDFLLRAGVTIGQGFWIARPMPAAALEFWIRDHLATPAGAAAAAA